MSLNVHSSLLDQVTPDEFYLLSRLANRINKDRTCFPGTNKLTKECGWSKSKLQRIKKSLYAKGFLSAKTRKNESAFTSNLYTIETPLISKYNGISTTEPSVTADPTYVQNGTDPISTADTTPISTTEPGVGSELGHKVLSTEGIGQSEELINKELRKEKQRDFFKSLVYKCLIDCVYPQHEKYADYYMGFDDFADELSKRIENIEESTVRELLKKIWGAAENLLQAFTQLNRPRPEFISDPDAKTFTIRRQDRKPKAIDEAEYQIKAYVDFCRISGRFLTTDPEKLPARLIECDWVMKLHDLVKPQIEKWKYDPVYDDDLNSNWLVELYYWELVYDGYVCKRQENRIVYGGEEYRKVNTPINPGGYGQYHQKQYTNPGKIQ